MPEENRYDAIVIGGGFAGVTAMRDLRASGHSVLLLEARDRLGGRTWYRRFADTQQEIEIGGTWTVEPAHANVASEKARYGLGTTQSPTPRSWRSQLAGRVLESWAPVTADDAADFERALYAIIAASHRITLGTPYDQQGLDDLDVSFEQFLAELELSAGASAYFTSFIGLFMGCTTAEVSALHAISWVAGMGNSPWVLGTTLTDKFADGTKSLIDAMVDEAGADVRLETRVVAIDHGDDGVVVTTGAGERFAADAAVLATPLNTWTDVAIAPPLSPAKRQAAQERHSGHAVKLFALARNVPEYLASASANGGLSWLSTEYELPEGALMVGFAHSPDVVDVNDPEDVARVVREIVPEAEVVAVDGHDWNGDELSQGTWMAFKPGQLTRFHSELLRPEGRLVFAGSDVALRWPGWIEGALESGVAAAEQVQQITAARAAT